MHCNDIVTIVKSFSSNTPKVELKTLITWYMCVTPQTHILRHFLIETFPTLTKEKDDETWNLDGYGPIAASEAIISIFKIGFQNPQTFEAFRMLLHIWIARDFFTIVPSQWHNCNVECESVCSMRKYHLSLLELVTRIAIDVKKRDLCPFIARLCILYNSFDLIELMFQVDFTFSFEHSKSLFFSTSVKKNKSFVFFHSPPEFKEDLKRVLHGENETMTLKNGTMFSSGEVFTHISDFTSCLLVEVFTKVRSDLDIKSLSLTDFIFACTADNYRLVKHMIDQSFPAFIKKRCHLTEILYALEEMHNSAEWNSVFQYVIKISDKKIKIHSEDTIYFMTRSFYADKKAALSSFTNWETPPKFAGGCPLLNNYEVLKELEDNKKLAFWALRPRKIRICVHFSIIVDPRCLFILNKYDLFGEFYH
jgi:hypothetical protein